MLLALSYEPASKVKPFVSSEGMKYIVASDTKATNDQYGIRGFPTYYVVDPGGKVAYVGHSSPEMEQTVERLLKEDPPKSKGLIAGSAGKSEYNDAVKLLKKKQYAKALKAYEQVAKDFKGSKYGKKAKAKVKKLKADKKFMAKVNAAEMGKKCKSWLDSARMMAKAGKADKATEYYQRIIDKYPKSKYAQTAEKEMKEL